jgi:hypothetical protein
MSMASALGVSLRERIASAVNCCEGSAGSSNPTKILAPIVQAVAVRVVNLLATRTEVFVHVNVRTINPCSCVKN